MLFDSHCHPQFPNFDQDRDEMIKRALKEGVFMICVGTDFETSKKGIELAQKYKGIWATIGLHPNEIQSEQFDISIYQSILNEPKVVAIGEVGLDYYRTPEPEKQEKQKDIFKQFVELAQKTAKPMVLHFRDNSKGSAGKVHKDALEILPKKIIGVAHSFTGNLKEAKEYVERGAHLGFNGIITFTDQYDETMKYAPLEKILLETDAPFLAPVPFRGKRNEPLYVKHVAEKIAELKGLSYNEVSEKTFENAKRLFGI